MKKYHFVTTLCNLIVNNCAYSSPDFINGSHIGSNGRISPLWELIIATHLFCGAGTDK